jgi:hypothetical protein
MTPANWMMTPVNRKKSEREQSDTPDDGEILEVVRRRQLWESEEEEETDGDGEEQGESDDDTSESDDDTRSVEEEE